MVSSSFKNIWQKFILDAFVIDKIQSFIIISPSSREAFTNPLVELITTEMNRSVKLVELPYPTEEKKPKKIPPKLKTTLKKTNPQTDAVLVFSDEGFRKHYHLTTMISSFKGLPNKTPCISFHDLLSNQELTKLANIDLFEIKEYTDKLLKNLKITKRVRLQTPLGTNILITPRDWKKTPIAPRFNGYVGYFPIGQVFTAPIEHLTEGKLVIDRLISEFMIDWKKKIPFPELSDNIEIKISNGKITKISGGKEADYLIRECLSQVTSGGTVLCELTFGTNPISLSDANIAAEDCARDTFHVGFGENRHLGGKNNANVHWDAVIEFDQKNIIYEK
ncbi:MAG: hypothetical protein U9O98_08275 [Asgard group archaeon]|nr:hypothetical protein [Asgard group archaeon]